MVASFKKTWRSRFSAFIFASVVAMLINQFWGVIASLVGGMIMIVAYNKSASEKFSRFENVLPVIEKNYFADFMSSQARNASLSKIARMCVTGLIILLTSLATWSKQSDDNTVGQISISFAIIFGLAVIAYTIVLVVLKFSMRKR